MAYNKESIIKKILLPVTKKENFVFVSFDTEQEWEFLKNTDHQYQQIISVYDNGLFVNLGLSTTQPGQEERKIAELIDGSTILEQVGGYGYEDKEDFEKIIQFFADFLCKEGFDYLNKVSEVSFKAPTALIKDDKNKKTDKLEELSEICNILNNLQSLKYSQKTIDELQVLGQRYGEWLIDNYGGEWFEENGRLMIKNCGREERVSPFVILFQRWQAKIKWEPKQLLREHDKIFV